MAAATPVPGFPARDKEESVRERLDLLLELVSNINEVLWLRDLVEERILYVSPAFARIWGRSVEQLLSSPGAGSTRSIPETGNASSPPRSAMPGWATTPASTGS